LNIGACLFLQSPAVTTTISDGGADNKSIFELALKQRETWGFQRLF
jgi:hypothetical protein